VHATTTVGSQAHREKEDVVVAAAQQSFSQEQSQYQEQHRSDSNGGDHDNTHSDDPNFSSHVLDPTAANIGLRQRRPPTAQTSNTSSNTNTLQQNPTVLCDSPEQTQRIYENIPGNMTITPIIRNGGGDTAVPNRPFPTPTTPNFQTTTSSTSQHRGGGQYEDQNNTATVPILNSSTIASSSSFRLAYRPRHVDYSQTIQYRNRNMGGLMGIVSGLVHSIDNIGVESQQQRTSQGTTGDEVPQIHRRDGGLGGIGRASEQDNEYASHPDGSSGTTAGGVMGEEDSSLAMAREFLSRLLLMLACFVILCLLLF